MQMKSLLILNKKKKRKLLETITSTNQLKLLGAPILCFFLVYVRYTQKRETGEKTRQSIPDHIQAGVC